MKPGNLLLAIVLIAAGAGGAWYWLREKPRPQAVSSAMAAAPAAATDPPREVQISIPSSEIERLHLKFETLKETTVGVELRVPGTVQPNVYKQVHVASLVGGVVRGVSAELGQAVKHGEPLVQIFSREMAEAQTRYMADNAELEAEHKKLVRTQELVRLGAASRQELEEIEANHQVHTAHVEESRQRLLLLGLTDHQAGEVLAGRRMSTAIPVPSPLDGTVTARNVNPGQVVNASQELLTITDLSSVWVEASLLEDSFASVHVGTPANLTTPAYAGRQYRGTVSYIDSQVDPQTRTAKVRIAVNNLRRALRFGMYMDVLFESATGRVLVAPKQAIQTIGESSVVFVAVKGETGRFIQRTVTTGEVSASGLRIVEGLISGETVVTDGSFLLRAESIRQHQ